MGYHKLKHFFHMVLMLVVMTGALPARAESVTYDFQITWSQGPLDGSTSIGSFALDAGLMVPNSTYASGTFVLDSFSVVINGASYTLADISPTWLSFSADGSLSHLLLGTNCTSGACYSYANNAKSWFISFESSSTANSLFASVGGGSMGSGSFIKALPVPELPALEMMALGWVIGGLMLRRNRLPHPALTPNLATPATA